MNLFSKRYDERRLLRTFALRDEEKRGEFLKSALRKRLQYEIKYIVSTGEFLEPFLLVEDDKKFYLHKETLSELSNREIGYDITTIFSPERMDFEASDYRDIKFLDLIELLIIFSRTDKRELFIARVQDIVKEEGNEYVLHGFMITKRDESGLRAITPLIKDEQLRKKVEEYNSSQLLRPNYDNIARITADILQMIFSSPATKKATKKYSEELSRRVAAKWVDRKNVKRMTELLNETVRNAKLLSNEISNIRHTDKHTIVVSNPNFYKVVAIRNISIAELCILSLPEEFIVNQDPEELKENYLSKFQIIKDNGWVVEKDESTIPPDIPF